MSSKWEPLQDDELRYLDESAVATVKYLVLIALASFFAGAAAFALMVPSVVSVALIGMAGSAVAALTSCLDRYANGFERENGERYPPGARKENGLFNRRFSRWLRARPFLGAVIAPAFVWGIDHFTDQSSKFHGSDEAFGFTAFMAGLLAKSVLDLIKGLFKNIFKT